MGWGEVQGMAYLQRRAFERLGAMELVPVAAPLVKLGAVTGHSRTQQREMFRAELQARDMSDEHVRTLLATVEKDSVEGAYWEHASWRHGRLEARSGLSGLPLDLALDSMHAVGRKLATTPPSLPLHTHVPLGSAPAHESWG